ncbi:MAG: HAD family hydrolase [Clostridia bacterium]|nr:HAD family hydrolase [Clostridia bacterium]
MIKAILFDLDGTLLPMDQNIFVKTYFGGLAKKLALRGYEPQQLINSVWTGVKAMIKNDGEKLNEQIFWDVFENIYGKKVKSDMKYFEEYYEQDFDKVQEVCGYNEKAKQVMNTVKQLGFRTALATNPIFPAIATKKRIFWAGLDYTDYELITTYENSRFCKPNLEYYKDVIKELNVLPEECVMVGNDVSEDMVASKLGLKVFLLTDCLINKDNVDISAFPNGSYDQLIDYVISLNR